MQKKFLNTVALSLILKNWKLFSLLRCMELSYLYDLIYLTQIIDSSVFEFELILALVSYVVKEWRDWFHPWSKYRTKEGSVNHFDKVVKTGTWEKSGCTLTYIASRTCWHIPKATILQLCYLGSSAWENVKLRRFNGVSTARHKLYERKNTAGCVTGSNDGEYNWVYDYTMKSEFRLY